MGGEEWAGAGGEEWMGGHQPNQQAPTPSPKPLADASQLGVVNVYDIVRPNPFSSTQF